MSRHIGEEEVVRLLRGAGRDVELDVSWVVDAIDGSTEAGSSRAVPSRAALPPTARPDRGRGVLRWRGPRRWLAVPLGAVLAGGVFVTVHAAVSQDRGRVVVEGASEEPGRTTRTPDARLGDAKSITAAPAVPGPGRGREPGAGPGPGSSPGPSSGPGSGSGSAPGSSTRDAVTGSTLKVTPVAAGTSYRLPLNDGSREWLLVSSSSEGKQQHVPADGSIVGPAQSVGAGQAVSTGPFALSWGSTAGMPSGEFRRWLTAPSAVRGVPAGLRIPVRVQEGSGTITLLVGTARGGGKVKVDVSGSKGPGTVLSQRLPECTDATGCPAVVTIELDKKHAAARGAEVMIELSASGAQAKVGLAAVELD